MTTTSPEIVRPLKVGYVVEYETVVGHHEVDGELHGFKYEPRWSVRAVFDNEADAERFREEMLMRLDHDQHQGD